MTGKALSYEMVCDRTVIKLGYDYTNRKIAKWLGRIEKHDMWSRDDSGPPREQQGDSWNRQSTLSFVLNL